jgi:hypothetical protein
MLEVDLVVGSEERVEDSKLVHYDPQVNRWDPLVAWNVSSCKRMASDSVSEDFV